MELSGDQYPVEQYNKAVDPEARKNLMKSVQKIIHEKVILIPLCENRSPSALGPRLKGTPYKIQQAYPVWFPAPMEDLELKD